MTQSKPSPVWAGIKGRCPRCGEGSLFRGFLTLDKGCSSCGLDYEFADAGDGPAVFIMFIVGFVVVTGMVLTEIYFAPPYWVQAMIWIPLVLVLSALLLRPFKGVMIALQYRHQAGEGRIDQ